MKLHNNCGTLRNHLTKPGKRPDGGEYTVATLQGDTARCLKPPVDFKPKVPFWHGLAWFSQAKAELLF